MADRVVRVHAERQVSEVGGIEKQCGCAWRVEELEQLRRFELRVRKEELGRLRHVHGNGRCVLCERLSEIDQMLAPLGCVK